MLLPRKQTTMGNTNRVSKELTVINKLGIHARPAALFVKVAAKFQSEITVEKDGEQINGKSIMGLMMLAAAQGSKLKIIAEGSDAEAAVRELEQLFAQKFNED
jgi:phosphocarrier protein HPr